MSIKKKYIEEEEKKKTQPDKKTTDIIKYLKDTLRIEPNIDLVDC